MFSHSGIQHLITGITFASLSSYDALVLWLHNRIAPDSKISSSECSLSEERMQGRRQFYREFAIQRKVQRSTGLIEEELAIGYGLIPVETFDLII